MSEPQLTSQEKFEIKELFKIYDKNNKNTIESKNLHSLLSLLRIPVSKQQLRNIQQQNLKNLPSFSK